MPPLPTATEAGEGAAEAAGAGAAAALRGADASGGGAAACRARAGNLAGAGRLQIPPPLIRDFPVNTQIFCYLRAHCLIVNTACVAFHCRRLFPCGSTCWLAGVETLDAEFSHRLVPGVEFCDGPS